MGNKKLLLPQLGIGCYSLSGAYGHKDISQFRNMIDYAYRNGITYFDTADAYGDAEEILGEAVAPFRDDIIISTKVGARENIKPDLSYNYLRKACEDSLRRLNTDYIDIYIIHYNDPDTTVEETVEGLERLIDEGKIKKYGLGHIPAKRAKKYLEQGNVFSILMEYSAVARKNSKEMLSLCKEYNTAGIAFSVTGRGLLTGKFNSKTEFEEGDIRRIDPQFQRERLSFSLKIMDKFREIALRRNRTPVQMAIAWVLAQPNISTALIGPSSIEHLKEDISGVEVKLSVEELSELDTYIGEMENWLEEEQYKAVRSILSNTLNNDNKRAFVDLVYCIETAITEGYISEEIIMPVFYKLFGLKGKLSKSTEELLDIQREIREKIFSMS